MFGFSPVKKNMVVWSNLRFRLTRKANSDDVKNLLLDGCGPLAELHTRVMEAGCEVNPDWKLGVQQ